jgi:DinB family protein
MDTKAVFLELYERIPPLVEEAVTGLDTDDLTTPPAPGANTIAWLTWHLTRVHDSHVAELLDERQLWETGDFAQGFGLQPDPHNTGYAHSPADVASVRPVDAASVLDYHRAVFDRTRSYLSGLSDGDLDRIVDENWDPPVSLGARLVSVAEDCLEHVGQANYVRGILERR